MFSIGRMFTLTVKGVEVPLVPMFMPGEILPRVGKTLLVVVGTAVVWGLLFIILWIVFDKIGAVKFFGSAFIDSIFGGS